MTVERSSTSQRNPLGSRHILASSSYLPDWLDEKFLPLVTLVYILVMAGALLATPFLLHPWMQQPFTGALVETTLVVGAVRDPQYSDTTPARLSVDDVLLALDREPLDSVHEYDALVRQHAIGDTITLTARSRGGIVKEIEIVLRAFTPRDQWFLFYPLYLLGLLFAFIGIWVFIFRRYDNLGRSFSMFSVSVGFALGGTLLIWGPHRLAPLWILAVGMSGAAMLNLAVLLPRPLGLFRRHPWLLGIGHTTMFVLVIWNWATMYNVQHPWNYIHARQALYAFDAITGLIFLGRLIYTRAHSEYPLARAQATFILASFLVGFGPTLVWLLLPQFGIPAHFSLWLLLPTVFFPTGLAYALLRYRVTRTDVLMRQALVYAAMLVIIVVGYNLIVIGVTLALGTRVRPHNPYLLGFWAFLVATLFNPVRTRLEQGVNRLFGHTHLAYQEQLDAFGRALVEAANVETVARLTRQTVAANLYAHPLHLFLYDTVNGQYRAFPDEHGRPTSDITFAADNPLPNFLERLGHTFFFDPDNLPRDLEPVAARLALLQAVIYVPLPGRERLVGFLALGPRPGRLYGSEEVEFLEALSRQAALAIERAQTVSDLERRIEQMNILARVAQGVNITLVFDDLLELLYAQTTRLVRARYFQVLLYEPATKQLQYVFAADGDERLKDLEGQPLEEGRGLAWEVMKTRHVIRTNDYPATCRQQGYAVDLPDALAWMGVPLNAGAETIGVMVLADSAVEVAYTAEQERLVQALADLAAGAIVKARLLEETRQRAAQLTVLNQITRKLSSTLDLQALLKQILDSAVSLLDAEAGTLFLVDEDTGELVFAVVTGPVGTNLEGKRLPPGSGLVGRAISERMPLLVTDVEKENNWESSIDQETNFKTHSVLIAPMITQDKAIGALEVINKRNGIFTADDEQLLLAFAGQAAIAIQNARLYTMTDQALAARVEELSVLQRIDRELNTSLDVRRAMQVTLDWAVRRTGAVAGLVGLLQEDTLIIIADQGYPEGELGPYHATGVPISRCPGMTRAVETHEPQRILAEESDTPLLHAHARAQIVVPIEREDQVIGLLVLESLDPYVWNEETVRFLVRLADHAAIAITNAQLYAEVQEANQTKSDFISFVAHELKTPMTSIRGYADLLAKGAVGPINDNQAQFLAVIRANVERMARLVSDLADISRIEAGKLELEFQRVDFHDVVDEVVHSLSQQIESKNQTLEVHIPDDLPPVWGDRVRLAQILTNLVSNAHKYTPEGGTIEIWAEHVPNEWQPNGPPEVVHVAVRDNGLGISEEEQEKIFQKFFRSEDRRAREAPGTGLGLHITKNLVELHGGRIWFESKLGEGTTFHFTVPIAED